MAKVNITFKIKVAWWLKYYLRTLSLFCYIFDGEPDMSKVGKVIGKAVKCKMKVKR